MNHPYLADSGIGRLRSVLECCPICKAEAGQPCQNGTKYPSLYRCPDPTCDQLYEHSEDAMNCVMHLDSWQGIQMKPEIQIKCPGGCGCDVPKSAVDAVIANRDASRSLTADIDLDAIRLIVHQFDYDGLENVARAELAMVIYGKASK